MTLFNHLQADASNQLDQKKAKSFTIVQTTANIPLKAVTSSSQAPTVSNSNTFFLRLSNTLGGIITLILGNGDVEISRLMKEGRCFNCKGREHTMLNCLKKVKISAITDGSNIDDIENID